MPTYEVVRGDTVWALTRRALTAQLGRAPTNREILEVVGQVQVPSGDVNLIRPGEQVTIPVGPAYDGGQETPPARGGAGPVGPGAGSAQYPSDMYPDGPFGPPGAVPPGSRTYPIPPEMQDPREGTGDPITDEALNRFAAGGPTRYAPYPFSADAFRSMVGRPLQNEYRDFNLMGVLGESVGDALPFIPIARAGGGVRAIGQQFLPSRALPSGARPALNAGPAGGYPAAGGGTMPFQFGPGAPIAATRAPFPTQASVAASRNPLPVTGPRPAANSGGGWVDRLFGSGGYTY
jgi:hypothetical protein